MAVNRPIPVIDLFAGPGGLGEGFSALASPDGQPRFSIRLSIEKDPVAHETLELRSFFRQFRCSEPPEEYYKHITGKISRKDLFDAWSDAATAAQSEAWRAELGRTESDDVHKRIRGALKSADPWVLIGGPPCQAYSNAGRSRNKGVDGYVPEDDPRQYLYLEYLQILADHRPAAFVMENVKGLLSAILNKQRVFELILEDLQSPIEAIKRAKRKTVSQGHVGYRIYSLTRPSMFGQCELADFVVRAEQHGIPQARHRIILIGIREDLKRGAPKILALRDPVPVRDVLGGLPKLRSGLSGGQDSPGAWKEFLLSAGRKGWMHSIKRNGDTDVHDVIVRTLEELSLPRRGLGAEFVECDCSVGFQAQWFRDKSPAGVCNYASRKHMSSDLHRYLFAACFASARHKSPTLRDFPDELLPDHANVFNALSGGNFGDRFRVQVWSRPATTITSHISKDGHYYIHPDPSQCRSFTVREAARIQTFPDNYFFSGGRTAQYAQVGNAVPPLMAREIAEIVFELLD